MITCLVLDNATENGCALNNHILQIVSVSQVGRWYFQIGSTKLTLFNDERKDITIDGVEVTLYLCRGTDMHRNLLYLGLECSKPVTILTWKDFYYNKDFNKLV